MRFQLEKLVNVVEEIFPILEAHYKEIAHYRDIELKPDWEKYHMLDRGGFMRLFTARSTCGELLGYAVFLVQKNLHYSASLQAHQDILYIKKENRGTGGKLIKWCDEQLKLEGVQVVYHHVKEAHNFGPLLERMGYELVDRIYGRRLDKGGNS